MAEGPKTSFIPKQSSSRGTQKVPRKRSSFDVLGFLAVVVFLAALIVSVGVFLWSDITEKQLAEAEAQLSEKKQQLRNGQIESVKELDRRMKAAIELLDKHLSPSVVFDMLEGKTQELIQLTGFSYSRNESGTVVAVLNGIALRFNTIALQEMQFEDTPILTNAIFSDVKVGGEEEQSDDVIAFKITADVSNTAIKYTGETMLLEDLQADSTSTGTTTSSTP